jgi:hypothetical protein
MAQATQIATKDQQILEKLDKKTAGQLVINVGEGGMVFANMAEVMEFAKLMSVAQQGVPPHCRRNPTW